MKVRIDYTTREVVVLEESVVFQHSHNIDYIQIAIDQYTPGLVYKLNFTDPTGVKNLSRYLDYIGKSGDLYIFRLPLNSTNTKYEGDLAMSMSIFTQSTEGEITTTTKIWNSETFYQHIDASEEDETIDIDSEETTIIDEIYAAIALKLKEAHKGYYFSNSDLGISAGTMTTEEYIAAVINALTDTEGDYIFDGVAIISSDGDFLLSDAIGFGNYLMHYSTQGNSPATVTGFGYLLAIGGTLNKTNIYYNNFKTTDSGVEVQGWKRYLNDDDLTTLNAAISAHVNDDENPHTVTKEQVGLGNVDNTADSDKPVSSAQQAALNLKANLAGGNTFSGQQNITGPVNITNTINANGNKINFVGNPVDGGDAVNKNTLDSELNNHDDSETSHEPIRLLIEELDREISRLDGRGMSYGEIPYTTAELKALDSTALLNTIIAAVEAQSWFIGSYSPSNGDLVYDAGVGDGVNYHEWEYNQDAGAWADNGAISSPKATNDIYGAVKGNSYVSIVAGLMQVLLADNATYLKDAGSSNKYTYQQIYDAITNRYTKEETNALFNALKAVYGWESTVLTETPLTNLQQLSTTEMQNYDMVIFEVRDLTNGKIFTQTLTKAHIINGARVDFFNSADVYVFIGTTTTTFYENANYTLMATGIKMDGTVHNEMRSIGAETITYRDDGKVSQVVADTVTTTPTYDEYGNVTKITEVYALDGKTFETTFTYDKFGRISATNKVEV